MTKTVWLNCKLRLKYLIHVCDGQNMSGEWVTRLQRKPKRVGWQKMIKIKTKGLCYEESRKGTYGKHWRDWQNMVIKSCFSKTVQTRLLLDADARSVCTVHPEDDKPVGGLWRDFMTNCHNSTRAEERCSEMCGWALTPQKKIVIMA